MLCHYPKIVSAKTGDVQICADKDLTGIYMRNWNASTQKYEYGGQYVENTKQVELENVIFEIGRLYEITFDLSYSYTYTSNNMQQGTVPITYKDPVITLPNGSTVSGVGNHVIEYVPESDTNIFQAWFSYYCTSSVVNKSINGNSMYTVHLHINNISIVDSTKRSTNEILEDIETVEKGQAETTNSILTSISDFFGSFFNNLVGIFVPESGYFENFFQRLNDFFAEKLGMLYAPIEMFIGVLTAIKDSSGSDNGIQFPGLKWEDTYIIQPQIISLSSIANDFPGIQEKIYFATDVIMVGAVVWLLQVKLKEVLTT